MSRSFRLSRSSIVCALALATVVPAVGACSSTEPPRVVIAVDGSSTVFPITEAVAEEFQKTNAARVTIGVSGTGGGFKKFCHGETALTGASRPIKPSEVELCSKAGVEWMELAVAYDGISVVVHPSNTWVDELTVSELKTLWEPAAQAKVTKWSQVRADWPDQPVNLYGPGIDSGTYDYFTKAVVGKEHASRGDFTSSEDDNVLVKGVSSDPNALGFFGFAYYAENAEQLKVVPIRSGTAAAVAPSLESIGNSTYQPLSRPIFVYVSKTHAKRPEVEAFIHFYLSEGRALVEEVGYIRLSEGAYGLVEQRFKARTTGSLFGGSGSTVGASIETLLGGVG